MFDEGQGHKCKGQSYTPANFTILTHAWYAGVVFKTMVDFYPVKSTDFKIIQCILRSNVIRCKYVTVTNVGSVVQWATIPSLLRASSCSMLIWNLETYDAQFFVSQFAHKASAGITFILVLRQQTAVSSLACIGNKFIILIP